MSALYHWCGFLGAWLLVAGPVYQAALELNEESFQRDQLASVSARVRRPAPVSPWWWLVPPVHYVLSRRSGKAYRDAVFAELTEQQMAGMLSFMNKATGWLLVASGGLLIAAKETGELVEHEEWPHALFWVLVVVMALLSLSYTATRMSRTRALLQPEK